MSPALFVRALVAALAHFVWQGALLALLLAFALRALHRAPAESRYAAAGATLAAMAAAPVVTFLVAARALSPAPLPLPVAALRPGAAAVALDPAALVAAAWGAGVALMLVRLTGGALRVRALVARTTPLPEAWNAVVRRLSEQLGLRRAVRLLASPDLDGPVALGWLRPAVILPASLALGLPTPAVEALLAHELAHVRRHDWAVGVAQAVVEALLFYHPAVWWVSSRVRAEREHCCDATAVALTGDALGYARALAALESTRTPAAPLAVAATGGSLMSRIEKIVAGPAPRGPRLALSHTVAVAALLLGAVAAPLASCASPAPSASAALALPPAVTRWMPQLTAAGQRHGVDPDLLAIVTMVESGGDPQAESPAGALGLMQVMPATARRLAGERHLDPAADLRDPEVNVDYGAFYLAAQLREHGAGEESPSDRTVELAAAAYNGGEDAVRAHLAEGKPLSDETVRYKDRVLTLWRQRRAAR